ncbi:hypothetical protein [Martelella limonii]|uniref:hypothetical protein n=1 Tax=Martelella limonii TaxID=1647649 RepID=UPI001580C9C1|nr:hypothetical protein [Martelella limonii]
MMDNNKSGPKSGNRPEVTPTEARQSEKGRSVIYVLIAALVLAGAVWFVMEMFAPQGGNPAVETVTEDAEQTAPAAQ